MRREHEGPIGVGGEDTLYVSVAYVHRAASLLQAI